MWHSLHVKSKSVSVAALNAAAVGGRDTTGCRRPCRGRSVVAGPVCAAGRAAGAGFAVCGGGGAWADDLIWIAATRPAARIPNSTRTNAHGLRLQLRPAAPASRARRRLRRHHRRVGLEDFVLLRGVHDQIPMLAVRCRREPQPPVIRHADRAGIRDLEIGLVRLDRIQHRGQRRRRRVVGHRLRGAVRVGHRDAPATT